LSIGFSFHLITSKSLLTDKKSKNHTQAHPP
jgi:hypothetical protein